MDGSTRRSVGPCASRSERTGRPRAQAIAVLNGAAVQPPGERLVATELLPRRSSPQAPIAKTFVAVQPAVRDLFGRRGKLLLEPTNLVVEAFDEHQKALLDLAVADPMSAFRLGAPVEPQDLVDALPQQGGGVGLLDLACYTEQGLLLHLVNHEEAEVAVRPMLCEAFGSSTL